MKKNSRRRRGRSESAATDLPDASDRLEAIETVYDGCTFRSRMEARWAVFFDAIGVEWEFEPEGYDLADTDGTRVRYVPDFFIPSMDVYIEIKPPAFLDMPPDHVRTALRKAVLLTRETRKRTLIALGAPHEANVLNFRILTIASRTCTSATCGYTHAGLLTASNFVLFDCPCIRHSEQCGGLVTTWVGEETSPLSMDQARRGLANSPRVREAMHKARRFRFWNPTQEPA